ncbi:MAG: hypothetical protein A2W35_03020 [Chloroflexi bacterium RBG_16_57_11]|nr:MAG: hypothetical protein A2W35_03020 [Chloroflexi bacterium RBG_16_57_11]
MSKSLLLCVVLILGIMILVLIGQTGIQQARLEMVSLQFDRMQQQKLDLAARQAQLDREKQGLLLQNQQMQQHLASWQVAYQQERARSQRLQAMNAVTVQLAAFNWSGLFWLGLVGVLTIAIVVVAVFAIARHYVLNPSNAYHERLEEAATDDPWASREYRRLAIQKARQIEQWERQSVLAYWHPHPSSTPSYQETTSLNPYQR